ncbi:TPA: hypothetical protein HA278_00790 [Candidatus Woesearchaeota archaeon]|nr:hypothetical protein [Candidatus Woesearchaeota archaeon]
MKAYDDVLLVMKMIESGIVPYSVWPSSESSLRNALSTLDSTNQRIAKRKFRKLWRKIVKSFKGTPDVYKNMKRMTGMGLCEAELSSRQRNQRAYLVYEQFTRDIQKDRREMKGKN